MTVLIIKESKQEVIVAFVDNTNFTIDREDCKSKIQRILLRYTQLYKVTRGFVEHKKTSYFCWRQYENIIIDLSINETKITQLELTDAIRILAVYICPTLIWDK